jgi:hypothetical protein
MKKPSETLSTIAAVQDEYPVFILGCERSGTSTMAYLLHETFGYNGYAEGHVFDLLQKLLLVVNRYFAEQNFVDTETPSAKPLHWQGTNVALQIGQRRLTAAITGLFTELVGEHFSGRWFDKTPGPDFIATAPLLAKLYPHALFIFIIRDPIANIESRMRKFGDSFEDACKAWSQCALAWLETKPLLQDGTYVELKTHDLKADPGDTFERIRNLLARHPLPPELLSLPLPSSLLTIERTALEVLGAVRSLDDTQWSDEQKTVFRTICGPFLSAYGFGTNLASQELADLTLPPPYGQRGIEVFHGEKGVVFPQIHRNEIWIFLHPSATGAATSLHYRDIDLSSVSAVTTTLTVLNSAGPECRLTLSISDEASGDVRATGAVDCHPNAEADITVPLPPGLGPCRIAFTSESLAESVDNAWVQIRCPRLIRRP